MMAVVPTVAGSQKLSHGCRSSVMGATKASVHFAMVSEARLIGSVM